MQPCAPLLIFLRFLVPKLHCTCVATKTRGHLDRLGQLLEFEQGSNTDAYSAHVPRRPAAHWQAILLYLLFSRLCTVAPVKLGKR